MQANGAPSAGNGSLYRASKHERHVLRCHKAREPYDLNSCFGEHLGHLAYLVVHAAARKARQGGEARRLGLQGLRHLSQIPSGGFQMLRLRAVYVGQYCRADTRLRRSSIRVPRPRLTFGMKRSLLTRYQTRITQK